MSFLQPRWNLGPGMAAGITRPHRNQREMRVHSGQQLRGGGNRAAMVSYFEQVRIRLLFGESLL